MKEEAKEIRFGGITPYLFYSDAAAMLDWLSRVFGFVEKGRWARPDGVIHNAEMIVGPTEVWIDGANPQMKPARMTWIGVWVDDPDAMYERAVAHGAQAEPPVDKEYGVRVTQVKDPEGYTWGFMRKLDRPAGARPG